MKKVLITLMAIVATVAANAQVFTGVDLNSGSSSVNINGTVASGEYATTFNNGSGSGFGGVLGPGSIFMDADAGFINFGFSTPGALNDIVVVYLDTKAGGFTDAGMSDTSDGGRTAVTNPSTNGNVAFASGFLPDYAIVFAGFGSLGFELTGGSLNFIAGSFQSGRETRVTRADIGLVGQNVGFNWAALYTSSTGFLSNETMPGASYSSGGNPGFGGNVTLSGFNRFEAVPEPGTMTALGLGLVALARRRKSKKS